MQRIIFAFLAVLTASAICTAQAPMKLPIQAVQEDSVAEDTTKPPDDQQNPSEVPAMVASAQAQAAQPPTPATAPNQQAQPEILPPQQEIAPQVSTLPAIQVGPAKLRVGGYLGLTGLFRSTNSGGNTGTSFNSIPYKDTVQGNVSETRLSAQASRLSLRIDADFPEPNKAPILRKLSGYFEMDFGGVTPGTVTLTSSSFGFRLRQAFMFAQFGDQGKFNLAAGQAFSLMTPPEGQLSIWPSDYEVTQAVDSNYVAGLVWGRFPQVRATWLPSKEFSWAVSVENPEQQIGKSVIVEPLCCASDLEAQYNSGNDELKVPNLRPDIVTRAAFDPVKFFHIDVGGVWRTFRHIVEPLNKDLDFRKTGVGASVNLRVDLSDSNKFILQGSYGSGFGRYIGGLVPDVVFRSNSSISPIRTWSWVGGIEQRVSKWTFGGYYSGLYTYRNVAVDTGGSFIGFGFPESSLSNNRFIQEGTGTATIKLWSTEDRGSMQLSMQGSYLQRQPWAPEPGLTSAKESLVFAQIRYNLP
jgi:hypothetical protein